VTRTSFTIGFAILALSIAPAVAADVNRFPPPTRFLPPAPVLRIYNWTGCYLGAQLGAAFADNNVNGELAGFVVIQKDGATNATGGGQVGCDLQFARNWVVGVQVDGAWTNLAASEAVKGSSGTLGAARWIYPETLFLKPMPSHLRPAGSVMPSILFPWLDCFI
jgi:outer membrane immunogenic protein